MRPVPGLNRFNGDVTPRKFFFQEEKRVIKFFPYVTLCTISLDSPKQRLVQFHFS